jgi:hypothetical protein
MSIEMIVIGAMLGSIVANVLFLVLIKTGWLGRFFDWMLKE